jgi:hypothetical protein
VSLAAYPFERWTRRSLEYVAGVTAPRLDTVERFVTFEHLVFTWAPTTSSSPPLPN